MDGLCPFGGRRQREWESQGVLARDAGITSVPPDSIVIFKVDDFETDYENDLPTVCNPGGKSVCHFEYISDLQSFRRQQRKAIVNFLCSWMLRHESVSIQVSALLKVTRRVDTDKILEYRFGNLNKCSAEFKILSKELRVSFEEEVLDTLDEIHRLASVNYSLNTYERVQEIKSELESKLESPFFLRSHQRSQQVYGVSQFELKPYSVPYLNDPSVKVEVEEFQIDAESQKLNGVKSEFFAVLKWLLPLGVEPGVLPQIVECMSPLKGEECSFQCELSKNIQDSGYCVINGGQGMLIFPTAMGKHLQSWENIQRNIYHLLLALMRMHSSTVPLSSVPSKFQDIFGVRFCPQFWGIHATEQLILEFYDDLIQRCDGSLLQLVIASDKNSTKDIALLRLMNSYKTLEYEVKEFASGTNQVVQCSPTKSIYVAPKLDDFVSMKHSLKSVGATIRPGSIYLVKPDFILDPTHFNVSLDQNSDCRWEFISKMTERYELWESRKSIPSPTSSELVVVKSLVAVKYEGQWLRGRVHNISGSSFTILLVDVGYFLGNVVLEDLRSVHKDFTKLPAQSFSCRLRASVLYKAWRINTMDFKVPEIVADSFYDVLNYQNIGIIPHEFVENFWEVDVVAMDDGDDNTSSGPQTVVSDLLVALTSLLDIEDETVRLKRRKKKRFNGLNRARSSGLQQVPSQHGHRKQNSSYRQWNLREFTDGILPSYTKL